MYNFDGLVENKDIANKFASNYETLYNSVISEDIESRLVSCATERERDIQSLCAKDCCYFTHCITVDNVENAVKIGWN